MIKYQMLESIANNLKKVSGLVFDISWPAKGGMRANVKTDNKKMTLRINRRNSTTEIRAVETNKSMSRQDGYTMQEIEQFCRNNLV